MKKLWSYWIGLCVFLFATGAALAVTPTGASSSTNNFLNVIGHGQVTHDLTANMAGMAALEAGPRNYRAAATLGWAINTDNRIKLTGEYLRQDIDYTFFSGVTRQWVQQLAVGLDYQYAFNDRFQDYFTLKGFYSHAPSVNLSTVYGAYTAPAGNLTTFADLRRIAGSNAGGISPGITTHLWQGGEATLAANWDDVVYDKIYAPKKTAQGFGGTLSVTQMLQIYNQTFQIGASASDRAPFNNYTAEVDWIKPYPTSKLTVGIFGGYVQGKATLPNTSIVGINLAFAMDAPPAPRVEAAYKDAPPPRVQQPSLASWVSDPAVYMPQVLAIPDESVLIPNPDPNTCGFAPPTFIGPIPNQTTRAGPLTFNSPTQFTGSNLTYTVTSSSTGGVGLPQPTVTINSTTGVVTWTHGAAEWITTMTITATNPCGATVSSNAFTATYP